MRYCEWLLTNVADGYLDEELYDRQSMISFKLLHLLSDYRILVYNKFKEFFDVSPHDEEIRVWCTVSIRWIVGRIFFISTVTSEVYIIGLSKPFLAQLTEEKIP